MGSKTKTYPNREFDTENFINYLFLDWEPLKGPPKKILLKETKEFLEKIGWETGKLYMCIYEFPWIIGDLEDPSIAGTVYRQSNLVKYVNCEPWTPFLFLGVVTVKAKYKFERPNWALMVKALIGGKIGYFPFPINTMTNYQKENFHKVFMEATAYENDEEENEKDKNGL